MSQKAEVFRELYRQHLEQKAYLNSLPSDIRDSFFDNAYNNSIEMSKDLLVNAYFGEHAEAVQWFLYEWRPGMLVGLTGFEEAIQDLDQYIDWLERFEDF